MNPYPNGPFRFTKEAAGALPLTDGKRVRVRDSEVPELALRIGKRDRAWILYTKHRGRMIEEVLGHHPAMAPAQARDKARGRVAALSNGEDPSLDRIAATLLRDAMASAPAGASQPAYAAANAAAQAAIAEALAPWRKAQRPAEAMPDTKRRALAAAVDAVGRAIAAQAAAEDAARRDTLDRLFDAWAAHPEGGAGNRTLGMQRYQWAKYLSPRLGSVRGAHLTPGAVKSAIKEGPDAVAQVAGPIMANRCLALLAGLLRWGRRQGCDLPDPCAAVAPFEERSRSRRLTAEEFRSVALALDWESDTVRDLFLLLMHAGVRKGNACAARWADFDLAGAVWTIPGEVHKSGDPVRVPLVPGLLDMLTRRRRSVPVGVPWVFPSTVPPRKRAVPVGGAQAPEKKSGGHLVDPAGPWARIKARAELLAVLARMRAAGVAAPSDGEALADILATRALAIATHTPTGGDTLAAALARWRAAAQAAGVPLDDLRMHDLRMHDLRRDFASRLGDAGASAHLIQHALGHRDRRSAEAYVRPSLGAVREAIMHAQRMQRALP